MYTQYKNNEGKKMELKSYKGNPKYKKVFWKTKITQCNSSIYELNKIVNRINFLNNNNNFKQEYLLQFINKRLNFFLEKKNLLKDKVNKK